MFLFINERSIPLMGVKLTCFIFIFILLAGASNSSFASVAVVKKDIVFIVRTPATVRGIATRFHVPVRTLTSLNHRLHKREMLYAGKKLIIPIWLQQRSMAQANADYNIGNYELDLDSLDPGIREDFLCVADIDGDTIRKIALDKEMINIGKAIYYLNKRSDSIADQGLHTLSKVDIHKMQMAQERQTGDFAFEKQIDSLMHRRAKISEEKGKMEIRRADYDYLLENATYAAAHHDDDNNIIHLQDWGDDPNKVVNTTKK